METFQKCKELIWGGSMTTTTLELVQAFPRTIMHDDILERCGLRELAYVGSIQLDLPLLTTLVENWDQDYCTFHYPKMK